MVLYEKLPYKKMWYIQGEHHLGLRYELMDRLYLERSTANVRYLLSQ